MIYETYDNNTYKIMNLKAHSICFNNTFYYHDLLILYNNCTVYEVCLGQY